MHDVSVIYLMCLQGDPLSKLFKAFARKIGSTREKLMFSFDGEALNDDDTAEGKDLEDEDKIDALELP